MRKLVKNVVERTYRLRRYRADGTPSDNIVAIRAESEDAAKLKIDEAAGTHYDWRVIEVVDDTKEDV